jgi:hypothetical protein
MGKASLRVLVRALVADGKTQYLVIRNALQRPDHFGRALTREEKKTITDILQVGGLEGGCRASKARARSFVYSFVRLFGCFKQ